MFRTRVSRDSLVVEVKRLACALDQGGGNFPAAAVSFRARACRPRGTGVADDLSRRFQLLHPRPAQRVLDGVVPLVTRKLVDDPGAGRRAHVDARGPRPSPG